MTKILLRNIRQEITRSNDFSFTVADILPGKGYREPVLINNLTDLRYHFKDCDRYEEYKYLLQSGAVLLLSGARTIDSLNDYATLSVFSESSTCRFTYPRYDEFEDYLSIYDVEDENSEGCKSYRSWSEDLRDVYKLKLEIIDEVKVGQVLILPRYTASGHFNFGIIFTEYDGEYLDEVSIDKSLITGQSSYVGVLHSDGSRKSNQELLQDIINSEVIQSYYARAEVLLDIIDNSLIIDSPDLLRFTTFCTVFSPSFKLTPDRRFTCDTYYLRELYSNLPTLEFKSKVIGDLGKTIKVEVLGSSNYAVVKVTYDDYEYECSGSLIEDEDFIANSWDCEILELVHVREGVPASGTYSLNTFEEYNYSDEELIKAYEKFEDYEMYGTVFLLPSHYSKEVLEAAIKVASPNQLTVLAEVDSDQKLEAFKELYDYEELFFFSGGSEFSSEFYYISQWLIEKVFSTIDSSQYKDYIEDSLYLKYNGYELEFVDSIGLNKSFIISIINSMLLSTLYPGISLLDAKSSLVRNVDLILSNFPRISNIVIEDVTQEDNTIVVNLNTEYYSNSLSKELNLTLIKNYG